MPIELIESAKSHSRLAEPERVTANGRSAKDDSEAADSIESVREYTAALFSGTASVKEVCDPEACDRSFLVTVEAGGSVEELV